MHKNNPLPSRPPGRSLLSLWLIYETLPSPGIVQEGYDRVVIQCHFFCYCRFILKYSKSIQGFQVLCLQKKSGAWKSIANLWIVRYVVRSKYIVRSPSARDSRACDECVLDTFGYKLHVPHIGSWHSPRSYMQYSPAVFTAKLKSDSHIMIRGFVTHLKSGARITPQQKGQETGDRQASQSVW